MRDRTEQARFIDVLCAAVITLWVITSFGLFVYLSFFEEQASLPEAIGGSILASFLFLFILVIPAFILAGIISLPMWLICKYVFQLNRTAAAIGGALTGLIILPVTSLALARDFSNLTFRTKEELAVQLIVIPPCILLGAISGWNGYRIAWNGRP